MLVEDNRLFYYTSRKNELQNELTKLLSRKKAFGVFRFGNIILIIASIWYLSSFGWLYAVAAAILLVAVFIRLVYKDLNNRERIEHTKILIRIQDEELDALKDKYYQFEDGAELKLPDHFYANDLDIIGHAS